MGNLAEAKPRIDIITINLMLGLDWMRTGFDIPFGQLKPGVPASRLGYSHLEMQKIDLADPGFEPPPAWPNYDREETKRVIEEGRALEVEKYWENIQYFLDKVTPYLKSWGVKIAVHPDDPPFPVVEGLPRLLQSYDDYNTLLSMADPEVLTLAGCVGSWASGSKLDPVAMVEKYYKRISWYHIRQVKKMSERDGGKESPTFVETFHHDKNGDIDMARLAAEITKVYKELGRPVVARADHGYNFNGDGLGKRDKRGYGFIGRIQGLMYLAVLFEEAYRYSD